MNEKKKRSSIHRIPVFRLLLIAVVCPSFACSGGDIRSEASVSPVFRPLLAVIDEHIETTTHMDGPRCPMYPSCAAWARRALLERGFLGLLLFIDRLFYRESGRLEEKYFPAPRRLSEHLRYYDPLEDTFPVGGSRRPSLHLEEFQTPSGN